MAQSKQQGRWVASRPTLDDYYDSGLEWESLIYERTDGYTVAHVYGHTRRECADRAAAIRDMMNAKEGK